MQCGEREPLLDTTHMQAHLLLPLLQHVIDPWLTKTCWLVTKNGHSSFITEQQCIKVMQFGRSVWVLTSLWGLSGQWSGQELCVQAVYLSILTEQELLEVWYLCLCGIGGQGKIRSMHKLKTHSKRQTKSTLITNLHIKLLETKFIGGVNCLADTAKYTWNLKQTFTWFGWFNFPEQAIRFT